MISANARLRRESIGQVAFHGSNWFWFVKLWRQSGDFLSAICFLVIHSKNFRTSLKQLADLPLV